MAFDRELALRMRKILRKERGFSEREMFGGIAFMIGGRMACGVIGNDLLARIDKTQGPKLLTKPHVRPMTFTGTIMKGFVCIGPGGTKTAAGLRSWITRSVAHARTLPPPKRSKPRRPRPFPRRS